MRFSPLSNAELEQFGLLNPGQYAFEVVEAKDTKTGPMSKVPGTDMIKLKLRIYDENNLTHFVYCNLVESYPLLLAHFCKVTKLEDKYKEGTLLAENCFGKKGYVSIGVKPASEHYKASNEVKDFLVQGNTQLNLVPPPAAPFVDSTLDDLPF